MKFLKSRSILLIISITLIITLMQFAQVVYAFYEPECYCATDGTCSPYCRYTREIGVYCDYGSPTCPLIGDRCNYANRELCTKVEGDTCYYEGECTASGCSNYKTCTLMEPSCSDSGCIAYTGGGCGSQGCTKGANIECGPYEHCENAKCVPGVCRGDGYCKYGRCVIGSPPPSCEAECKNRGYTKGSCSWRCDRDEENVGTNGCPSGDECCCSGGTICSGIISLNLNPNPVQPSGSVTPTAFSFGSLGPGCVGKLIRFRSGSCTGSTVRSCITGTAGCTAAPFTAPSTEGTYAYFATIDMNGDGDNTDAGECGREDLVVSTCAMDVSRAKGSCLFSCVPQGYKYIYCICDSGQASCNLNKYYCSNSSTNNNWPTYDCQLPTTTTTTTTILPVCSGSIVLMLAPNPIQPSGPVIPAAGGLLGCTGQLIRFRSNSCTGSTVKSCVSLGAMCIASSFTAPSNPGTYSYFATIDKNGDGDESDAGECDQEDLVVSSAAPTTTTTTTTTTGPTTTTTSTSTTTTTTIPSGANFKVALYGDYNLYTEYSSVAIDGESIGKACYEKVCSQCVSWVEDLAKAIDTSKYCSDGLLEVSFSDSDRVNYGCNANHRACVYANGKWNCCEKECSSYGCSNSVSFSCADWSCISGATTTTTTTTSTTIPGTTTTLAPSLRISCSACKLQQSCICSLSGTCNSGLWVVKNKVSTPFSSAIVSGIPPSTVTYVPTSTGELEVWASCLNPVAVEKTSVEVG